MPDKSKDGGWPFSHLLLLHIREDVQVVGGGQGDNVLLRMPRRVQDLASEVERVGRDLVVAASSCQILCSLLPRGRRSAHFAIAKWLVHLGRSRLPHLALLVASRKRPEEVVVRAGENSLVIATPSALKLVKYGVVLVQLTQLGAEMLVHCIRLDGSRLLTEIPHLDGEVVPREQVLAVVRELHIRHGGDDLGEEGPRSWVLRLLEDCNVLVAERLVSHVAQSDGSLGGGVHEPVALSGMELRRRNHLRQLFHVGRLDVHDVCRLVGDFEMPQVDSEVVCGEERLLQW
ncbi:hypothetical protein PFISCL1PPCAC_22437, partial [Pristionchus fissidentatus]